MSPEGEKVERDDCFKTLVADPPWPSMHQRSTYHRGKPERHYETMDVEEICALQIPDVAKDAHLWIWGINRSLDAAYQVARAWGFEPISLLTWRKTTKDGNPWPGMGYYLRGCTEHVVFASRGKPMVPENHSIPSVFDATRQEHSRKAERFYEIVEEISPGPYLELFARRERPGWERWGNEVQSTVKLEAVR